LPVTLAKHHVEVNLIFFVIPAYNEQENIGALLENIRALGFESGDYRVIVVDDGSRDRTVEIVQAVSSKVPVQVVSHPVNQGVGAVFRTGFDAALKLAAPSDVIVTMEADNTSDLAILPEMLRKVSSEADLVLASCYAPGGRIEGTNVWRKVLSWGANLLLVLAFPIQGVKTYSSFYRAYKAGMLAQAIQAYDGKMIEQPGFVCMVEVLVKMHRLGVKITEVPMVLRINMRKGASKMKVSKTIRDYIGFILTDLRQRGRQLDRK